MFQVEVEHEVGTLTYRVMFTRGDDAVVCLFASLDENERPQPDFCVAGVALKSPKDAFDWTKGRRVAFARAVDALMVTKDERAKLWEQFKKRYIDNQPKPRKDVLGEMIGRWIPA